MARRLSTLYQEFDRIFELASLPHFDWFCMFSLLHFLCIVAVTSVRCIWLSAAGHIAKYRNSQLAQNCCCVACRTDYKKKQEWRDHASRKEHYQKQQRTDKTCQICAHWQFILYKIWSCFDSGVVGWHCNAFKQTKTHDGDDIFKVAEEQSQENQQGVNYSNLVISEEFKLLKP